MGKQLPLFGLPTAKHHPSGKDRPAPFAAGSDTSRLAAADIRPLSGELRLMVLACITATGDRGATCDECEVFLGMKHQTASARINELMAEKYIEDSGRRRKTRSGRQAVVWKSSSD